MASPSTAQLSSANIPRMDEAPPKISPWLLIPPVILTNIAAMSVQALWAHAEISAKWPALDLAAIALAVVWAITLEAIAVYLSAMAHAARLADHAAGSLQLAAYGVGAGMGALNYSHFAADWTRPDAIAIGAGFLSLVSPWLWSIWSRHRSRQRLAALGQVDRRMVKLSTSRKFWHPFNSLRVLRWASWSGVIEPDAAVAGWERSRSKGDEPAGIEPVRVPLRPVIRPVVIKQNRITVRRVRATVTTLPRAAERPAIAPPPWGQRPAPIERPVSPGAPSGDMWDTRLDLLRNYVKVEGFVPNREQVKALLRQWLGQGCHSTTADNLIKALRAEQESAA